MQSEAPIRQAVLKLPANTRGVGCSPKRSDSGLLFKNGKGIAAKAEGDYWIIKDIASGSATLLMQ